MEGLGNRVRLGRLKFLYRDPKWYESVRIVHRFVDKHIDAAIETEHINKDLPKSEAIIGKDHRRYILLNEMAKQTNDRLSLRSQILAVFMPSRDTTAFLVSNVFHALARNTKTWNKLRQEVLKASLPLTFAALKSINHLQWVINESTSSRQT